MIQVSLSHACLLYFVTISFSNCQVAVYAVKSCVLAIPPMHFFASSHDQHMRRRSFLKQRQQVGISAVVFYLYPLPQANLLPHCSANCTRITVQQNFQLFQTKQLCTEFSTASCMSYSYRNKRQQEGRQRSGLCCCAPQAYLYLHCYCVDEVTRVAAYVVLNTSKTLLIWHVQSRRQNCCN